MCFIHVKTEMWARRLVSKCFPGSDLLLLTFPLQYIARAMSAFLTGF